MVDFHRLWRKKNLNYCPQIVDHYKVAIPKEMKGTIQSGQMAEIH